MNTGGTTLISSSHQLSDDASRRVDSPSSGHAEHPAHRLSAAELSAERIAVDVAVPRNADQMDSRLAATRAALVGAGLGGWLGMLTGLVLVLFIAGHAWLTLPLTGLLIGAFLGAFVGFVTHWATDGRRDRPSRR